MTADTKGGWGTRIKSALKATSAFKYEQSMEMLGRGKSSVFEYEKEQRLPDVQFLQRLSSLTGVSIDWIATGKGPRMGGLDRSALSTAILAALKITESARAQGKQHQPDDVAAFIVDIYESVIKSPLDDHIPSADSGPVDATEEAPHARDRKTHS